MIPHRVANDTIGGTWRENTNISCRNSLQQQRTERRKMKQRKYPNEEKIENKQEVEPSRTCKGK